MLTLFIIPLSDFRTEKTIESFSGIDCNVKILDSRNFNEKVKTKWKIFMFNNEVLTEELNAAIPIFIKEEEIDIYKIYKKKGQIITIAPRLFKSEIELKNDCFLPVNGFENYKIETILNGFIK